MFKHFERYDVCKSGRLRDPIAKVYALELEVLSTPMFSRKGHDSMVELETNDFPGALGENVRTIASTTAGVVDARILETLGDPFVSEPMVCLDLA